jgi:acyl-coenzyme A synthetase/AMP-(fatty) acid ligase/pimeloyl-ACP methyl ester carboxylesterase
VADSNGAEHRWHVLDNRAEPQQGTMLCVHGNPTWSYLWRRFLDAAPPGWRVVAVDQLGMGWSERLPQPRRLADRIADLGDLTAALGLTGPVISVGHDWGGPISLGWALNHRDQLRGIVLANTAVHHDPGSAPPALIRLARTPRLLEAICVRTPAFVRGAAAFSRPALAADVRIGLAQPYPRPELRAAVGDFVADIPLEPDHPSRATLDDIAEGVKELAELPALVLWGARDPVFTEQYLADLEQRLPRADVQRYADAAHLVTEDVPEAAEHVWRWVNAPRLNPVSTEVHAHPVPATAVTSWRDDSGPAVVQLRDGRTERISFGELADRVEVAARALQANGVRPGDRVGLLIPPGIDLTVAVYACWQAGAVIVVADAGLGLRGLARAIRAAGPEHLIGIGRALLAARTWGLPAQLIPVQRLSEPSTSQTASFVPPDPDAEAAVLFTSGATGPAKGVVYTHGRLAAQVEQVRRVHSLTDGDRLVAAFAPFALYGPALGVAAAVPDMTVTAPGTLTAVALAEAVAAVEATVVFASPAALRNVVATAADLASRHHTALAGVRLVMSAGAPVPASLLRSVQAVVPNAELHTPYGMTEVLPVTDIDLREIEAAGLGNGVCVGRPLPGVQVRLSPLDDNGEPNGPLTERADVTGEICVSAAHVKLRYDRLWVIEQASARDAGWHRTGDVGHFDDQGRLWVEGRLGHVIGTPGGPVTPVGIEQRVEQLPEVAAAAAVGVGPPGTQQIVLVVQPEDDVAEGLAPTAVADQVRSAAAAPVAAVLQIGRLPTDIRHNSKIDRSALAGWAGGLLAGHR